MRHIKSIFKRIQNLICFQYFFKKNKWTFDSEKIKMQRNQHEEINKNNETEN